MMRIFLSLMLCLIPLLGLSADLNFDPPPGDYSVIFLSNIFGIVDGVLHGSGSQILGAMFGVFNSAVMALGGIIIMYTLIVSTMNTASEGEFLGAKWSSIWVPVRSVVGIALLMPKASGYCMIQIFVMWVIVQGVGAADKVWNAALDYLNRGGVIVQAQMNQKMSKSAGSTGGEAYEVAQAARVILEGQVCMLVIQGFLEQLRNDALSKKNNKSGICYEPTGPVKAFCDNPVPDFLASVNAVDVQQRSNTTTATQYNVPMPHFTTPPYSMLTSSGANPVCGKVTWMGGGMSEEAAIKDMGSFSNAEMDTIRMTRAIAIQQMYTDLSMLAQAIVRNMPLLNPRPGQDVPAVPGVGWVQFGVPLSLSGETNCTATGTTKCVLWGPDPQIQNSRTVLFNGTEFQGAIRDYNAVMAPTLRLMEQSKNKDEMKELRKFINEAKYQGWMMAGSYFFKLAQLNAAGLKVGSQTDKETGLAGSTSPIDAVASIVKKGTGCSDPLDVRACLCGGSWFPELCQWMAGNPEMAVQLQSLLNGLGVIQPAGQSVNLSVQKLKEPEVQAGIASSTVDGLIENSMVINLQEQPGQQPVKFALKFNIGVDTNSHLAPINFGCGYNFWTTCVAGTIMDLLYNNMIRTVLNFLLGYVSTAIQEFLQIILYVPLNNAANIFITGVAMIQSPQANPIIALANMGVLYINQVVAVWVNTIVGTFALLALPYYGVIFVMAVGAIIGPIVGAWYAVMAGIGFTTAYYVPFLPYMIFTFGFVAWLMAVIEAMVAAPIVALGVSSPEGDQAFGKADHAIMLLMNVFLRPSMMVIGYIAAIVLSFVSVWVINAGFANAVRFIQGNPDATPMDFSRAATPFTDLLRDAGEFGTGDVQSEQTAAQRKETERQQAERIAAAAERIDMERGYPGWAGIFGMLFCILMYTMLYLTVVQESFNLITKLPDSVLRWIGGQPETFGQEAKGWTQETKGKMEQAGEKTAGAIAQSGEKQSDIAMEKMKKIKGIKSGGGASAKET